MNTAVFASLWAYATTSAMSRETPGAKNCVPLPASKRYQERLEAAPTTRQMRRWQQREAAKKARTQPPQAPEPSEPAHYAAPQAVAEMPMPEPRDTTLDPLPKKLVDEIAQNACSGYAPNRFRLEGGAS